VTTRPMGKRHSVPGVRGYVQLGEGHEHVPTTKAPCCGMVVEISSNVGDERGGPSEGNWSVCYGCGAVLRYQTMLGRLELRMTTRSEREGATDAAREELRKMQASLRGKA
jgi:hypothetical protein